MTIQALTIINADGDVLVHRNFTNILPEQIIVLMQSYARAAEFPQPVFILHGKCVVHAKISALNLFATVNNNGDAMVASWFLQRFIDVLKAFIPGLFDKSTFVGKMINLLMNESDLIVRNQPLIQELMDEMIDGGEVITTDPQVLKLFVQQGQPNVQKMNQEQVTIQATKQNNYRSPNTHYKENSIALDVTEYLNVSVDATGNVLDSSARGSINVDCRLSGMPDCSVQLNDRASGTAMTARSSTSGAASGAKSQIAIDDVQFHHCVRLQGFQMTKAITFVPPDGQFQLMKFVVTQNVANPFSIHIFKQACTQNVIQIVVKLKTRFAPDIQAQRVLLRIPCPPGTTEMQTDANAGSCRLSRDGKFAEWRIARISGSAEETCRIQLSTTTSSKVQDIRQWRHPSCLLDFQIPNYTASGIQVLSVGVVDSSGYEYRKTVSQKTVAGSYEIKW